MEFNVCVGSWGAYNEGNEKSYGSEFIDFSKYDSWEEIEEELRKQGFDLEGEDEELFIQDLDFEMPSGMSGDYTHPKWLFETLKKAKVFDKDYYYKEMLAYCEVDSWDDFRDLVKEKGEDWDSDILFQEDVDGAEFARNEVMDWMPQEYFKLIDNYFDYDKYFEEGDAHETKYGVIQIL